MHGTSIASGLSYEMHLAPLTGLSIMLQVKGEVDVLVNNAGMATSGSILEGRPLLKFCCTCDAFTLHVYAL